MFFSRSKPVSVPSKGSVAIIGTSPLAFLLADSAQSNNFAATIIVSPKELAQNRLPTSLTIQSLSLKSHQAHFCYADTRPATDFCIIASKPEKAKTDLLLLSKDTLNNTPIINFSHIYNKDLITELNIPSVFPSYFDSWLNLEKNTIKLLERKACITIGNGTKEIDNFAALFEDSLIELSILNPKKKHLWLHLVPYVLSNLILLEKQNQNISLLLQKQDYREQINAAAKELCNIAKSHKETVSETDVFSRLYTVPAAYKTQISSVTAFHALASLIPEIDKFATPALYGLLMRAANKY